MKDNILIKGNQHGLTIQLNEFSDFLSIKEELKRKLEKAKSFFGQAQVLVQFEGKTLNNDQTTRLVQVIQEASDLEVICVIDDDLEYKKNKEKILNHLSQNEDNTAEFCNRTLRSGQKIEAEDSLVIMGDVNNGALVKAGGNVIVIGQLRGVVQAGLKRPASYIVALSMKPVQLRIGDTYGRAADHGSQSQKSEPQVAYIYNEQIVIEPINNHVYKALS